MNMAGGSLQTIRQLNGILRYHVRIIQTILLETLLKAMLCFKRVYHWIQP